MKKFNKVGLVTLAIVALTLVPNAYAAAVPAVNLGSAESYSIFAGSTITNTGPTTIGGDLGLSPGTAVTGFPPGILNGEQHLSDAEAIDAKNAIVTAYNDAMGRTPATSIGTELGGTIILPGVYTSNTLGITGTVTLDAQGDPNAVFILKADSTLITAASGNIVLTGGAQACNVFWQVGSSATLGVNSDFKGTILALTSVTLNTGVSVEGRILARNGAVTLDSNNVTKAECETAAAVTTTEVDVETETSTTTEVTTTEATTTPVVMVPTATTTSVASVTPVVVSLPNSGSEPMHRNPVLLLALLAMGFGIVLRNTEIKSKA